MNSCLCIETWKWGCMSW